MKENDIKKILGRLVGFYAKIMKLDRYPITIKYEGYEELEGNYAEVFKDESFGTIVIRFNCEKMLKEHNEIEGTVIHELMHVLLWPLRNEYRRTAKTYVSDSKVLDHIDKIYTDSEHEIVFLMEKILSDGYANKSKKIMDNKSCRKDNSHKKDIPEGKTEEPPKGTNQGRNRRLVK